MYPSIITAEYIRAYRVKAYQFQDEPKYQKILDEESQTNMHEILLTTPPQHLRFMHSIRADFWNVRDICKINELDQSLSVITTPTIERWVKDGIFIRVHSTEEERIMQTALGLTEAWCIEYKLNERNTYNDFYR